jgi:hypothetical protein
VSIGHLRAVGSTNEQEFMVVISRSHCVTGSTAAFR